MKYDISIKVEFDQVEYNKWRVKKGLSLNIQTWIASTEKDGFV